MKEPVIKAINLSKRYGDIQALKGINIEIMRGEFCVIAGPNGAGKTTFLRIIYGDTDPSDGKIFLAPLSTPIGVMPQEAGLYEDLTVWEHVYYLTLLKGVKNCKERAEWAIEVAGLERVKNRLIRDLSGGYKRRVSLAQALSGSDDLLLLDEPTSGLDPEARKMMLDSIKDLHKKGATIIFTTHYLDEIEREIDRLVIFNKGEIIHNGDKKDIMDRIGYDYEIETTYEEGKVKSFERMNLRFSVEDNTIHLYLPKQALTPELFSIIGQDITLSRPSLEEAYLKRVKDETH
ncbi:MAG: ABC transporter ATP-binding protein [Caldisericum sp.]|jgi:ABC-type multidrug transport system ATPase subunit|nr:ABC transporter ATP-binding protein [Caldisericum sp.]